MDADALFFEPFHPTETMMDAHMQHQLIHLPRGSARVKYYFIDFGLSTDISQGPEPKRAEYVPQIRMADGQLTAAHWVTGRHGRDQDVPELSDDIEYNALMVDIFTVGNFLRKRFYDVSFPYIFK